MRKSEKKSLNNISGRYNCIRLIFSWFFRHFLTLWDRSESLLRASWAPSERPKTVKKHSQTLQIDLKPSLIHEKKWEKTLPKKLSNKKKNIGREIFFWLGKISRFWKNMPKISKKSKNLKMACAHRNLTFRIFPLGIFLVEVYDSFWRGGCINLKYCHPSETLLRDQKQSTNTHKQYKSIWNRR